MFLWVLEEVRQAAYADRRDIHAVPLMVMFDFAEAIDGVSVLARSGAAKNCSQLLRTAWEIQMSLKYMLEHKSPESLSEMCRNACHLCNGLTLVLVDGLVPHLREEMRQRYIKDIKPGLAFIDSVEGL